MLTGQILLQLIVILIVVQLFRVVCLRLGQQAVVGEILAGLALGPSLLGVLFPEMKMSLFPREALPTLQTLGELGLMLYMFTLGTRLEVHVMLNQRRAALAASFLGIVLPFGTGILAGFFLYPAYAGSKATLPSFLLLIGTALAITAFPVLARLLTDKKLVATRIGTLALTCAAVDDVIAWCLLALVVSVARAHGVVSSLSLAALAIVFFLVMLFLVRPLFTFLSHRLSVSAMKIGSVLLMVIAATITNAIGLHPLFGAFIAGLVLPRRPWLREQEEHIDQINTILFLPLFFIFSGLQTQLGLVFTPVSLLLLLLLLFIACLGKIVGGVLGAKVVGRNSWRESLTLGVLMNTRGLVELVVLNIGLDLGILSPTLFSILVVVALVTTMMASPLLNLLLNRRSASGDEDPVSASVEVASGSHNGAVS
uniref:Cation/H+ exchanger transmembrane domain-containing protein n=1 Tax=Thermosporothrix sp. COM3 TaxID=2490863 RepID=A0A455SVF9_9CHLR|nr:hypothetical protein KTC_63910 [Thermosporothrix sp. COM3]